MDFDDRLRRHMHDHGEQMVVRSEGAMEVATRSKRRRQRRTVATAAAATIIVVGVGAFILNTANSETRRTATANADGVAAATATTAPSTDFDALSPGNSIYGPGPGADIVESAERVFPEVGAPLRFTEVDSTNTPAGYDLYDKSSSGDFYYVLSSEFGSAESRSTDAGFEDYVERGVNTLYTFDGTRWAQNNFSDRFVDDLDSLPTGLLYAVSTGTTNDRKLEIGESTDAGATWSWKEIDLTNQFGADPARWPDFQVQTAANQEQQLVVVSKPAEIDWTEAVRLARKAGVDIELESDEIYRIDQVGIEWAPNEFRRLPCPSAYNEYLSANENDLNTAADLFAGVQGCQQFSDCLADQLTAANDQRLAQEQLATELGIDLETFDGEIPPDIESDYFARLENLPTNGGLSGECGTVLYGDQVDAEPVEPSRITWAELGVTTPSGWLGNTRAYLVEQGEVTELGSVFGDTGFMIDVTYSDGEFNVVFDNVLPTPEERRLTFVSSNATDWDSFETLLGGLWPSVEVGDIAFAIAWGFDGGSGVVLRSTGDRVEKLLVEDLLGEIDRNEFELTGIAAGPLGLVAWMSGGFNEDGDIGSIVLFSPDGVEWGATELPGVFVIDVIVGDDGVMVFVDDPFGANEQSPPPILLGTL